VSNAIRVGKVPYSIQACRRAAETRAWEPNVTNFSRPLAEEAIANYTWFDKLTTGFKV
jgi:hypothetical protein